jgi:hypothetical protein
VKSPGKIVEGLQDRDGLEAGQMIHLSPNKGRRSLHVAVSKDLNLIPIHPPLEAVHLLEFPDAFVLDLPQRAFLLFDPVGSLSVRLLGFLDHGLEVVCELFRQLSRIEDSGIQVPYLPLNELPERLLTVGPFCFFGPPQGILPVFLELLLGNAATLRGPLQPFEAFFEVAKLPFKERLEPILRPEPLNRPFRAKVSAQVFIAFPFQQALAVEEATGFSFDLVRLLPFGGGWGVALK